MKSNEFIAAIRNLMPDTVEMDVLFEGLAFDLDGIRISVVNAAIAEAVAVEREAIVKELQSMPHSSADGDGDEAMYAGGIQDSNRKIRARTTKAKP